MLRAEQAPRPISPAALPAATPAAAKPAPESARSARPAAADVFERGGAQAVSKVSTGERDAGKLMRDYLTGAIPPPADFAKVMGYEPRRVETAHGTRMQDPLGSASAPGGIGPTKEFDPAAKTHDYGYDLLRYYGEKGQPLPAEARKAADSVFREDLFNYANDQKGFFDRWKYRGWAQIYATAVELNSVRQGHGVP
jgi:hypothetical protein